MPTERMTSMKSNRIRNLGRLFSIILAAVTLVLPLQAFAEDQVFYLGKTVNAGLDTGYSEANAIEESDPHFGWSLGSFYISGFTSVQRDNGTITFLKTTDDKIALHFRLDQDIDCLNGKESLTIANDTDGYDEQLGVKKSEDGFGRGTLIVRQTDYQNAKSEPQVYVDYLTGIEAGADTEVQLFEEGDYEVIFDYEIKNDVRNVLGLVSVLPEYHDYTIRFSFSVRNGNTMVFLFDTKTGDELTNSAFTENGFAIDLARSRYLDINVKRETLSDNGNDLVEDTRYNGPAKDGEQYTEPGVYTITVSNPSTSQSTEKIICVGDNDVLKAYAKTGYSIKEIQSFKQQGAFITDTGDISWKAGGSSADSSEASSHESGSDSNPVVPVAIVAILVVAGAGLGIALKRRQSPVLPHGDNHPSSEESPNEHDAASSCEEGDA